MQDGARKTGQNQKNAAESNLQHGARNCAPRNIPYRVRGSLKFSNTFCVFNLFDQKLFNFYCLESRLYFTT